MSASLGRERNAARSVNPGMRRQAITEPLVLHEHMFACQDGRNGQRRKRMEIRGIGFVGSHTTAHVEMRGFLRDVLGLTPIAIDGVGAELFAASNGDVLAVAPPYEEDGSRERTIGLIVDDLDGAIAELHAAGVETDGISENARWRYSHFRMPDGKLYELVEERAGTDAAQPRNPDGAT
jgi:hypothetical protein